MRKKKIFHAIDNGRERKQKHTSAQRWVICLGYREENNTGSFTVIHLPHKIPSRSPLTTSKGTQKRDFLEIVGNVDTLNMIT